MTAKVIPLVDQRVARRGLCAHQDQHGGQERRQRSGHRCDGAALQGQRPHRAIVRMISAEMPLIEAEPNYIGEVAGR